LFKKKRTDKVLLRVEVPIWFRILYAIVALPTLLFFLAITVVFTINGLTLPRILTSAFVLFLAAVNFQAIPHLYSTIWVTEFGLRWRRPFRLRTKTLAWDDILTISRPRFGIPRELAYIISKGGEKIVVMRSMTGFDNLFAMIATRAPHLPSKHLDVNLWPEPSTARWTQLLLFAVLFLIYVIIRELFG
jgi:hypothetical protein